MKALFRISLCAGVLSALLVGGGYARPQWASRLGFDFHELATLRQRLAENRRRSEALDRWGAILARNLLAREEILQALREQRINLLEAATQFRDLNRALPEPGMEFFRRSYEGETDEERFCRQVITFARHDLMHYPEAVLTAERLEAELSDHLRNGPIRFEGIDTPQW